MDCRINIPIELLDDEIVCLLAVRYHTSPHDILRTFLSQDRITSAEKLRFSFEENEMEMMHDLTQIVNNS